MIHDDRQLWTGIGYIMGALRFKVQVSKSSSSKAGYKVKTVVKWAHPTPPIYSLPYIRHVLDMGGLSYSDEWSKREDISRFVILINTLDKEYNIRDAFVDRKGLHMFMWVTDNPPPYDYDTFIEWAKAYDSESEMVENLL
tara:strand:+ start:2796 stop:3215 length:420 start_codon:yes stop_codon:yes gene_type:complete